jgi:hypothetical protein
MVSVCARRKLFVLVFMFVTCFHEQKCGYVLKTRVSLLDAHAIYYVFVHAGLALVTRCCKRHCLYDTMRVEKQCAPVVRAFEPVRLQKRRNEIADISIHINTFEHTVGSENDINQAAGVCRFKLQKKQTPRDVYCFLSRVRGPRSQDSCRVICPSIIVDTHRPPLLFNTTSF